MSETKSDRRAKIQERIEKRQNKDDMEYLNSKSRVAKGLAFSILEYIIVFILVCNRLAKKIGGDVAQSMG